MRITKARLAWPLFLVVLVADWLTKRAAELHLAPAGMIHPVLGDVVRLRLSYNRGAAMGLSLGAWSRPVFGALAVVALVVVWRIYRQAARDDWRLGAGCGLLAAGAAGNLLDRLRSPLGVVDFIDLGTGTLRFWTFNVADVGVTAGAAILAALLWSRDGLERERGAPDESQAPAAGA